MASGERTRGFMSLYERINKKNIDIPSAFDLDTNALYDIKENSIDLFDLMVTVFKFGYMQGKRAERKAGAVR